ncbi:two-component system response regulator [Rhodoferax lacus]|uniref:Two-component system response regulator n=1 Tax=Rhodoferax lacus TaxID=2184758 RepID=A0A3E1RG88_9BURK|nr:HD domain-containing phosphohydrolase [Rhodoferax lacus]RFO98397.1 two-component system response regulator [Rhodoferax lacus]
MPQQVLIVDDTEINLILFGALVKKLDDCRAQVFDDSRKALAWVTDNVPDLIIVDYMMPDLDGLEFIRLVRDMPGHKLVPILMITANDQKEIRYRALDLGANDFLTKPIDKVEFLARARNMLSLNQARKHMADHASWLSGEVRKATQEIVKRERETVYRLAKAAEYRDPETGAHILRMANYSMLIARELGLSVDDQQLILEAAPMHDIGKVGIADSILLKPGRLTAQEFDVMKQHAMFGYELLHGSSSKLLQAAAEIAKGHHEKFDGSGYPNGIKGEAIPIFSRIVAVADVFDALTSERPYKKAWEVETAVDFLNLGAGSHFDPACVKAFLNAWDDVELVRNKYQEDPLQAIEL